MNRKRLSVLSIFLVPALSMHAQWRSVHAVETTTETITKDGNVRTNRTTSEYFRSASGSELTITILKSPDGLTVNKTAKLYDAEGPTEYSLDYGAKTAYVIAHMPAPKPLETNRGERYPELQRGTYEGIDCILVPAMLEGKQRMGTVWVDDKDDLELKTDITFPGGPHRITELSDITFDYKADPGIFRIPADFRVDSSGSRILADAGKTIH